MTDMIFKTDGEEKFRIPSNKLEIPDSGYLKSPGTVCPKTPLHICEMTSKETIQTVKEDIAVLQEKLKKLEELEIQNSKSPAEKAFYRVYGYYPTFDGEYEDSPWQRFVIGYNAGCNAGYYDVKGNNKNFEPTSQEQENNEWRNVALRFGEELVSIGPCGYYDMTADDWLEWAKGAYEKNSDDLLKFMREKQRKCEALTEKLQEKTVIEPKPPTLLDIVYEWCDDDNDLPCEELVNRIEEWLPDEFDPNEAYEIGWNEAIQSIKEKLR